MSRLVINTATGSIAQCMDFDAWHSAMTAPVDSREFRPPARLSAKRLSSDSKHRLIKRDHNQCRSPAVRHDSGCQGRRLFSATDPLGRTVEFEYDLADRVIRQTHVANGREIEATYDASSNVATLTPPDRPAHGFSYTPVDLESRYSPPQLSCQPHRSSRGLRDRPN